MSHTVILVTGANGQVGRELQDLLVTNHNVEFHATDARELDITDISAVRAFFDRHQIDYCLNCAAFTAVDKAETQAELARRINVEGPRNLAEACNRHGAALLQLSTDYVYHGQTRRPLRESDPTDPQSVYARTKLDGECAASAACPRTLILRTAWVYSPYGQNFVKTMLRLGAERDRLTVVNDQIGSPTYARDLARAIWRMVQQDTTGQTAPSAWSDIYHYSNEGETSWYDFARAIFELADINIRVAPVPTTSYPTPARRPPYSLLDKSKIRDVYGVETPHWRESLAGCLTQMGITPEK